MGIWDAVKKSLVEDDTPVKTTPPPIAPVARAMAGDPFISEANGDMYHNVAEKTAFETSDAGKVIQKYLSSMENLPLDQALKLKTAIAQAKKLDGLTDDSILATFDAMKSALAAEQTDFTHASDDYRAKEIDMRHERIQVLTEEINTRQEELAKLTSDLSNAQADMARLTSQFETATQRRSNEIEQERTRYTALLKG